VERSCASEKPMSGDAKSGKIWTSKKLMNDAQIRDGNCLRSRCHGSQPSYSMLFVMAGESASPRQILCIVSLHR
jgi:hypothetical protein